MGHPRGVGRNVDDGKGHVTTFRVGGAEHAEDVRQASGIGGPQLVTVHHPLVSAALRSRRDMATVRPVQVLDVRSAAAVGEGGRAHVPTLVERNFGVNSSMRGRYSRGGMIGDMAHTEQLAAVARPTSALDISSRQRADMIAFIPPPGGRNDLRQARTLAATTLEVPIASRGRRTPQAHRSVLAGALARQFPSKYARIGSK